MPEMIIIQWKHGINVLWNHVLTNNNTDPGVFTAVIAEY
jgi:hypothetical protein